MINRLRLPIRFADGSASVDINPPPTGGSGISVPTASGVSNYNSPLSFEPFFPLILAIIFWAFSMFLWSESERFQRWLAKDVKDAPDPSSGFGIIAVLTVSIGLLGYGHWYSQNPEFNDVGYFLSSILQQPKAYAPLVFLMGLVPAAVAFVKYLMAIPLALVAADGADQTSKVKRSPGIAMIGAAASAVNLVGSIITIWVWWNMSK